MKNLLGCIYLDTDDMRKFLVEKYKNKEFDLVGNISLIGTSFIADKGWIIREPNYDYVQRELEWYKSMSRNVHDIPGGTPKIWEQCADENGLINSNYGWCIWSEENYNQYDKALDALISEGNGRGKGTRQAIMYFTRPTMHEDAVRNGMHDHMCTYNYNFKIENDKLYQIVNMRSNDAVYGYDNDYAFADYVFDLLLEDLKKTYPDLTKGVTIWKADNFHVYPRHFKFLEEEKQD